MSHKFSVSQCRFAFLFMCSMLLGLRGAVAQSAPEFLQQRGVSDTVHSELLNEDRLIYVDFPLDYTPGSAQKYPVAFLLDGDVLLPAAGTVQDYYSGGFTPDMIIIGISNAEYRTRDLTPPKVAKEQATAAADKMEVAMTPNAVAEDGAAVFLDFIEKELVPYVEANYPVTHFRTLIGHSYGGLFTMYALAERPTLFFRDLDRGCDLHRIGDRLWKISWQSDLGGDQTSRRPCAECQRCLGLGDLFDLVSKFRRVAAAFDPNADGAVYRLSFDHGDWRRGYARGGVDAEFLFGLGGCSDRV